MAAMSSSQFAYMGGRLQYVVVPIKGKVKRSIVVFDRQQIGVTEHNVPKFQNTMKRVVKDREPGFMVYFPMGHVLRLTERQLRVFRLNRAPGMADMRGVFSANSPLGELMMAQTEEGRMKGFQRLEAMTVHLATRRTGIRLLTRTEVIPDEFEERPQMTLPDLANIDYKETDKLVADAA